MKKLSTDEIQSMEVRISKKEDMISNYINSRSSVKLTLAEINNIELMKLENLLDKVRTNLQRMEAEKQTKSSLIASKPVDFIAPALLEKALYNSKIEAENQKTENAQGDEDRKFNLAFHESFCS